jgi:hypothetical protein
MKKIFVMILTLMIAMLCISASANTVYTKVAVDPDVAAELLSSTGMPNDQIALINPIVSLVNALGVNVTTVNDGAQIDLDLNGTDALSLGLATTDENLVIASTLFPNFIVTMNQATLGELLSSMPVAGAGANGMDSNAMMEVFGKYITPWMEACVSAGIPGEPVKGEYEFEGYTFDTMVPVTVDIPAITEATKTQMKNLMADPAAIAMLKSMAQSSGAAVDEASFEKGIMDAFEEWIAHFPSTASSAFYSNSDGSESFYMTAEATREKDGAFTAYMLFEDQTHMSMGYQDGTATTGAFVMADTDMSMYFQMGEMYIGLSLSIPENLISASLFINNPIAPLLNVYVVLAEGGERTLSMDIKDKTVLPVEDIMNDASGKAAQGLLGDIMGSGMNALMETVNTETPDFFELMNMFSGNPALAK